MLQTTKNIVLSSKFKMTNHKFHFQEFSKLHLSLHILFQSVQVFLESKSTKDSLVKVEVK